MPTHAAGLLPSKAGNAATRAPLCPPQQATALPGPSCTTAADGTCILSAAAVAAARAKSPAATREREVSAYITAPGHGPLLVPRVPTAAPWRGAGDDAYRGVAVLDRALVKPGDDLHVTGDQRCATRVVLAAARAAVVVVSAPPPVQGAAAVPAVCTRAVVLAPASPPGPHCPPCPMQRTSSLCGARSSCRRRASAACRCRSAPALTRAARSRRCSRPRSTRSLAACTSRWASLIRAACLSTAARSWRAAACVRNRGGAAVGPPQIYHRAHRAAWLL